MDKTLRDTLRDEMQAKNMNAQKLAEETGVPERYVSGLLEGHMHELPPAPYVRGYLVKIGTALNIDGNALWETFSKEGATKSSGSTDVLPQNRFAIERINRNWYFAVGALVVIVLYLGINSNRLFGKPELTIGNPSVETLVTTANSIDILGTASLDAKVTIDGEVIPLDATGHFEKQYPLRLGLNAITVEAKTLLGKTVRDVRQVIYQP